MEIDQPIALRPLTFLAESGEVTVGRTDIDSYAVFPPDGAALMERLAEGATLRAAADWYARTYGETVDLDDFLTTLYELDFVASETDASGTDRAGMDLAGIDGSDIDMSYIDIADVDLAQQPDAVKPLDRFVAEFEWYAQAMGRQRAVGTPY